MNKPKPQLLATFLVALFIYSCTPLISLFDSTSYKNTIDLKVDFVFLVKKSATTQYSAEEGNIESFEKKLAKAYEYEKGRFKNDISIAQYKILDSDEGSIKQFFKLWKEQGTISAIASQAFEEQASAIFDQILKLENGKRREGIKLKSASPDDKQSNN